MITGQYIVGEDETVVHFKVTGLDEFIEKLNYEGFVENYNYLTKINKDLVEVYQKKLETLGRVTSGQRFVLEVKKIIAPHIIFQTLLIDICSNQNVPKKAINYPNISIKASIVPLDRPDKTMTIRLF